MGIINDSAIESVSIDSLFEHPKNPRHGSVEAIAESISANGFYGALIVQKSTNQVLAGNHRLKALRHLGITEAPVIFIDVDDDRALRILLADNRANDLASYNQEVLANILDQLSLTEAGLDGSLFDVQALEDVLESLTPQTTEGKTDPDDVPEAPKEPITKPGDLWILGDHRLICADSTDASAFEPVMAGAKADLWLTDPPYNVNYEGKTADSLKIKNDAMHDSEFRTFLLNAYSAADQHLRNGAAFYIWHADSEGYNFRGAARDVGWKVRQCLIWVKSSMVMGRQDYHWKHEPCLYGWKDGAAHFWNTDRKQTTVLEFAKPSRNGEHPTMKPVDLFEYQMANNTKIGDVVLDSFGGSGTTLIAAERIGRKARIVELDPIYCDVIVKRWEDFTGKKAVLSE